MTSPTPDPLAGFPVVIQIPIQWGEMDAYGHLNNTVYFRLFESARIVYHERCGFDEAFRAQRIGPILHSTSCRFRLPMFYPDTAFVGARVSRVEEDRMLQEYRIISASRKAVAAEGSGIIVSFDYEGQKKVRLPESVRAGIALLQPGMGG
jgi:acyl-CoA thioester hydrolase